MPGVICNIVVKADLGRTPGRFNPPPVDLPVDLNGNFRCLPLELILADHLADLTPLVYLPVDLNGNFGCLSLELI